jgi:hypothetical protein
VLLDRVHHMIKHATDPWGVPGESGMPTTWQS